MTREETALITGASSGIGLELARILASTGRRLILVARTTERLEGVADELRRDYGADVVVEPCDLGDANEREALLSRLRDSVRGREIDILVNNAGFGVEGPFSETNWEEERKMIDLNVVGLVHLTKTFLRPMLTRGRGRILQVASTAAFSPGPRFSLYFASKAFVLSFSEALAAEITGSGVTVTTLCPGPTHTGFEARLGGRSRLFQSGLPVASAQAVASCGYRAMMAGKRVAVHGRMNRFLAWLARVVPRGVTLHVAKHLVGRAPTP
jgi:short-subunit dehydrogenase